MKRRPLRQRPKRIIENLPDNTLREYLRALIDLRDKSENAIYKVDLALAIIKRHPKINVTKLCSSIMNTEKLFDFMAEYLGDELKKYGFNLHDFYNSNYRQIDCPLLHHNLPCPNIRLYSPDEGTAIQRALAFLEDAPRYLTKSAIKVENQNLGQDQSETRYFVITDPQWTKMQADAELGTTWIDQVYEALAECYINKIILYTDEDEGEVPDLRDPPDDISEDELWVQWETCKDGIISHYFKPESIKEALENAYVDGDAYEMAVGVDEKQSKDYLKKQLLSSHVEIYLQKRCNFNLRDLRNWGFSGKLLIKLIREYFDSINISDITKPGSDRICRKLTDKEKDKDPLYKFHPHDKNPCLHFILSTGMWGQTVEDFMRDSGHTLTPYDYNDLVVKFLLATFTPSSSRIGLKKINEYLHMIYSEKYHITQKQTLQKKLVKSFIANRFPLEWYEFYDKKDEQPLMDKIRDGRLA